MIRIKQIKTNLQDAGLDAARHMAAVKLAYRASAELALKEFKATTRTWKHQPDFTATGGSDGISQIVGTDDRIYGYVDEGTRPHLIRPRGRFLRFASGYRAKTSPNTIGSRSGGAFGSTVYARAVRHPGTKPRNFTRIIGRDIQAALLRRVQQAIAREAAKG